MPIADIFSVGFIVIALAVMILVNLIKAAIEAVKPGTVAKPVTKKLVLPAAAVLVGCGLALLSSVVPVGLAGTVADRLIFGAIAGGLATVVWRALTAWLKSKFGIDLGKVGTDMSEKPAETTKKS